MYKNSFIISKKQFIGGKSSADGNKSQEKIVNLLFLSKDYYYIFEHINFDIQTHFNKDNFSNALFEIKRVTSKYSNDLNEIKNNFINKCKERFVKDILSFIKGNVSNFYKMFIENNDTFKFFIIFDLIIDTKNQNVSISSTKNLYKNLNSRNSLKKEILSSIKEKLENELENNQDIVQTSIFDNTSEKSKEEDYSKFEYRNIISTMINSIDIFLIVDIQNEYRKYVIQSDFFNTIGDFKISKESFIPITDTYLELIKKDLNTKIYEWSNNIDSSQIMSVFEFNGFISNQRKTNNIICEQNQIWNLLMNAKYNFNNSKFEKIQNIILDVFGYRIIDLIYLDPDDEILKVEINLLKDALEEQGLTIDDFIEFKRNQLDDGKN